MAKFNSAEYTKLRDIAQKRQKRLSAAGYAAPIHIPTVKEIKAGIVSPGLALFLISSSVLNCRNRNR